MSLGQYLVCSEEEAMKIVAQQHLDMLPQQTSIIKLADNFGGNILDRNNNTNEAGTEIAIKARKKIQQKRRHSPYKQMETTSNSWEIY